MDFSAVAPTIISACSLLVSILVWRAKSNAQEHERLKALEIELAILKERSAHESKMLEKLDNKLDEIRSELE
jgi:predicted nuclease with TOPRIM domain